MFDGNRFYPALKTLEQLEHTYLPRVSSHWFSQTMADDIPKQRESIKEASMTDLKDLPCQFFISLPDEMRFILIFILFQSK
jgi:hypothetical protein